MAKAEHQRRWRAKSLVQRREYQRAYRIANPEKTKARAAINNRLYRGVLHRPDDCEACGATGPVDAHHEDHSRPLDVRWLCRQCHATAERNT